MKFATKYYALDEDTYRKLQRNNSLPSSQSFNPFFNPYIKEARGTKMEAQNAFSTSSSSMSASEMSDLLYKYQQLLKNARSAPSIPKAKSSMGGAAQRKIQSLEKELKEMRKFSQISQADDTKDNVSPIRNTPSRYLRTYSRTRQRSPIHSTPYLSTAEDLKKSIDKTFDSTLKLIRTPLRKKKPTKQDSSLKYSPPHLRSKAKQESWWVQL